MATISNATVDSRLSALGTIYGTTLARVTDMTTLPTDNDDIRIELTATGTLAGTIYLTYNQLAFPVLVENELKQGDPVTYMYEELKTGLQASYALVSGNTAPHSYEEWRAAIEQLKTLGIDVDNGRVSFLGGYQY